MINGSGLPWAMSHERVTIDNRSINELFDYILYVLCIKYHPRIKSKFTSFEDSKIPRFRDSKTPKIKSNKIKPDLQVLPERNLKATSQVD